MTASVGRPIGNAPPDPRWASARRILAIRLDTMGDVLMTSPAIRALRESALDRRITLLTSPAGAEAARLIPEVDEVAVYAAPWMKATARRQDSGPDFELIDWLIGRDLDAAVIFTTYSQSPLPAATICHLARIPLRLAHCRENPYQLLSDWRRETEPETEIRHEARRQLDLVASIGATTTNERLSLRVPPQAMTEARALLQDAGVGPETRWLALHAGASAPSRRYEHFGEVVRRLSQDLGYTIVFTGTEPERELVDDLRREAVGRTLSLVGRLDLARLAALLHLAPVLVSNNTGPVHVAAAVGTPVVDLYALTNPQHTPWQVPSVVLSHDVPCRNCYQSVCPMVHHDCLRRVEPGAVVAAVQELVSGHARPENGRTTTVTMPSTVVRPAARPARLRPATPATPTPTQAVEAR